ncbi:hypothetical protein FOA52_010731 [Chlamydomonas sp. UWO 241]|nr:hypothetical protein FOA52_010731 [Chlamydomonas sp. UWO 241]
MGVSTQRLWAPKDGKAPARAVCRGGYSHSGRARAGAPRRCVGPAAATRATAPVPGTSGSDPSPPSRRKALLYLAEASLDVCAAVACELRARPAAPGDDALSIPGGILGSLAPQATPTRERVAAQAALESAQAAAQGGRWREAADGYTRVLELAPRQWKLINAARLGRAKAWAALGEGNLANADSVAQWFHGRGVRWPFHYAIIYALLRAGVVELASAGGTAGAPGGAFRSGTRATGAAGALGGGRSARPAGQWNAAVRVRGASADGGSSRVRSGSGAEGGRATRGSPPLLAGFYAEGALIVACVAAYNYLLLTYGLDY